MFANDGKLIGIITSNSKHGPTNASIPKLNYSISTSILQQVRAAFENPSLVQSNDSHKDEIHLQQSSSPGFLNLRRELAVLDEKFASLSHFWNLSHVPPDSNVSERLKGQDRILWLLNDQKVMEELKSKLWLRIVYCISCLCPVGDFLAPSRVIMFSL